MRPGTESTATRIAAIALIPLLLGAVAARAQSGAPGPASTPGGGAFVQVGLEPQLVVSLGYLHEPPGAGGQTRFAVGARVKVSPYLVGDRAGRLNLILAGRWRPEEPWGVNGTGQAYVARGRNRAATLHGLGIEFRVAPGHQGDRWRTAADLGWQATLLTHIRHSDAAKEAFEERYPDGAAAGLGPVGGQVDGPMGGPVDGWYGSTAHRFRIGFLAERRIGDSARVRTAFGGLLSLQRQGILVGFAHGQVPAYLEASIWIPR